MTFSISFLIAFTSLSFYQSELSLILILMLAGLLFVDGLGFSFDAVDVCVDGV